MGVMTDFRAVVDGTISFANGGGVTVEGFRLDLPAPDITHPEIGQLLVASLGLLMSDEVQLTRVEVVEEAHKGTRGGPADRPSAPGPGVVPTGRSQPPDPSRHGHPARASRT